MTTKKHPTSPSFEQIVRSVFPQAASRYFPVCHEWEIYESVDWERAYLLGSGSAVKTTIEEDIVDYKSTEEAAWEDASKHVTSTLKWFAKASENDVHTTKIGGASFSTYMAGRRRFRIAGNSVSKKEFLRKLALAKIWKAAE